MSAEAILAGHTNWVYAAAWSPSTRFIVSASTDQTLRVWSKEPAGGGWSVVRLLKGHTRAVTDVCFSPDGQLLLSLSHDGTIRIWDCKVCETAGLT